ncbi:uncharacterized protein [Blastocystis hominis]|uniref:Uncharacterized protein n=1 Tax=Blastocystis hominis TaxID=12968 RepID=D8LZV0_BLAHO|nr:uncharacterized protein [Blastocystis hominis]CBK21339.2 unnamed protein product [Blastocystis hominis]|eukprot:XP_012895387.1 uncharacterized protein [Blastocystis hominis]
MRKIYSYLFLLILVFGFVQCRKVQNNPKINRRVPNTPKQQELQIELLKEILSAKRDLSMNQALENKRYKKYLEEEEEKLSKKLNMLNKEAIMLKIESDSYYNELNLLNEKLDSYEQLRSLYPTVSDTESRFINDIKLDFEQSIQYIFRYILAAFEDVLVRFDAWESGIKYQINLLRLDPDRRVFIDFITSIWNYFANLIQTVVQRYG